MKKILSIILILGLLLIAMPTFAAIEDFTVGYTENDPNTKWTVTAPKALGANVSGGDGISNLYKSFGADHFDSLNLLFEQYIDNLSAINATVGPGFLNSASPDLEKRTTLATTDPWVVHRREAGGRKIDIIRGNFAAFDTFAATGNTLYFSHMERAAGNDVVTLKIYDDSDRTNLVGNLSIAGLGTVKWQYFYGFITHPDGAGAENWYGFFQNFDLQEVAVARRRVIIVD